MRFIQLTDEAGCEVWVNLDAVSKIVPAWHENGRPTALEISFDGGLAGVTVKDPAEIERLKHILSLIAGDPAAKVERFQALQPAKGQEEDPVKKAWQGVMQGTPRCDALIGRERCLLPHGHAGSCYTSAAGFIP